jgi:hypothetical protein
MILDPTPQLAPPGMGLPPVEAAVARWRLAWVRRHRSRERLDEGFRADRLRIRERVAEVPVEQRGRPVCIPRVRGLEDSSRFWSVWMVLEHLRICHRAFAEVVTRLAAGERIETPASTAAVKPSPGVGAEVESAFEASCEDWLAAVRAIEDLGTAARYVHPWFGPLDAAGWQALATMHLGIHRRQLERIIRGLSAERG